MKYLPGLLGTLFVTREMRANLGSLARYLAFLGAAIAVYTVIFRMIMDYEGQSHSWLTGLYWVLVVMTTLGFGDVTFDSDLGRLLDLPVARTQAPEGPWLDVVDECLHTEDQRGDLAIADRQAPRHRVDVRVDVGLRGVEPWVVGIG